MTTLRVFKSTFPSINYIFKNGKAAIFQQGVFRTDVEWEIKELEAEVAASHPHIFIDENEREIDSEMVDPMNALRAKIIADYIAQQAAATNPANDMGNSDQSPVKPSNSRDVAVAAAGGDGTQTGLAVRLMGIKKE